MFWLEDNLIHSNVLINEESNFDDKYVEKSVQLVFNWSEFHLFEMTCYKIHTLKYRGKKFHLKIFPGGRKKSIW